MISLSQSDLERFWVKVDRTSDPHGCWIWTAALQKSGHGAFRLGKRNYLTHRLSWIISRGEIPDGQCVLHNCPEGHDNPSCLNPTHLKLGTHLENFEDMRRKGRGRNHPNAPNRTPTPVLRPRPVPTEEMILWAERLDGISALDLARFFEKVGIPEDPEACWTWTGSHQPEGYGILFWNGRQRQASHFSYALHVGEIPTGMLLLHTCDNPPCCNFLHLKPGTHWENMNDRRVRGRAPTGDRHRSHTHPESCPRGEAHFRATLTREQVLDARERYRRGESYPSIARIHGVSKGVIGTACRGETWKHIP